MKIVKKIQLKIVIFTPVKNGCMLHGLVCVSVMRHRIGTIKDLVYDVSSVYTGEYLFTLVTHCF